MDDRHGSDRPSDRQPPSALRAYEHLVEALGGEIQRVNRSGAAAFAAGEHAEASRLLERATTLAALCQEVEALGVRLRGLLDETAAPVRQPSVVLDRPAAPRVPESPRPERPAPVGRRPSVLERAAAGRVKEAASPPVQPAPRRRKGEVQRTPQEAYRVPILRALVAMGGSAEVADVLELVFETMKGSLTAHDLELVPSGQEDRWRNAAKWCRNDLCKMGLLLRDSPHGVWEISQAGREWLQRHW